LKRRSLGLFDDGRPNKINNKMSGDMGSVPDPKIKHFIHECFICTENNFNSKQNEENGCHNDAFTSSPCDICCFRMSVIPNIFWKNWHSEGIAVWNETSQLTENDGPSKLQDMNSQDMKMQDVTITGKWRQGVKLQNKKIQC